MANESFSPVEIQRNDQGGMRIQWDDGHESRDTFTPPPRDPFQMVDAAAAPEPTRLSTVGNYALNIEWRDGHRSGIYPWEMLRAMCPCPQCTASSG
jgi:DUF971 family protein